jgi:hypothetical protein
LERILKFHFATHTRAQVTGQSAGQSAMDHVFRNFSDYVEGKEKSALKVELLAKTEEATVLRDKSVDELCSNLALRLTELLAKTKR